MALETGTHISDLNAANPVSTDGLAQADDHLRLIKSTILASFPNITGAITATHTILNGLDGRVSAIENGVHASGKKMLFQQSTGPTGWTKDTTHNDKALRVVSGTASTGGSVAFTTAFASQNLAGTISNSVSGSTASHTLTASQIPAHSHSMGSNTRVQLGFDNGAAYAGRTAANPHGAITYSTQNNTGGGRGHSHGEETLDVSSTFTGTAINLEVNYVDVIIATKD